MELNFLIKQAASTQKGHTDDNWPRAGGGGVGGLKIRVASGGIGTATATGTFMQNSHRVACSHFGYHWHHLCGPVSTTPCSTHCWQQAQAQAEGQELHGVASLTVCVCVFLNTFTTTAAHMEGGRGCNMLIPLRLLRQCQMSAHVICQAVLPPAAPHSPPATPSIPT